MKIILITVQSLILSIIFSGLSTPSYALSKREELRIEASIYLSKAMCMSLYMGGDTYKSPKKIADLAYNTYKKENASLTRRMFNDRVVKKTAVKLLARHSSPKSQCINTMFNYKNKSDRRVIKELKKIIRN